MPSIELALPTPRPFEFRLCLFGHGWVALAPHSWDETTQTFATALAHQGGAVDVTLRMQRNKLRLTLGSQRRLSATATQALARQVTHMLGLEQDLRALHQLCAHDRALRWASERGAGRLLRSATVFEDLMKLLFTTNIAWGGTEVMTRRLVELCGAPAPSGRRAFPTPAQCPQHSAFWREQVKVGYRADAAIALARGFATGALTDTQFLHAAAASELFARITSLRGFGPYAAGQAMRLFGHFQELALDSWCRAQLAQIDGSKQPPADREIARRYAPFAPFQGLALWLDLTASWHGEAPGPTRG